MTRRRRNVAAAKRAAEKDSAVETPDADVDGANEALAAAAQGASYNVLLQVDNGSTPPPPVSSPLLLLSLCASPAFPAAFLALPSETHVRCVIVETVNRRWEREQSKGWEAAMAGGRSRLCTVVCTVSCVLCTMHCVLRFACCVRVSV